jgi:hypothetical protein
MEQSVPQVRVHINELRNHAIMSTASVTATIAAMPLNLVTVATAVLSSGALSAAINGFILHRTSKGIEPGYPG